jgi:purine catabolism regulator
MQRATAPAFVNLRGGEIALVSVAGMQALDERMTLASLVERLAHVPVAAISVLGEASPAARKAADSSHVPLLLLPEATNLREVEREIQRLIGDYEAQLDRRAAQLANALTQRSLAGVGLQGMLDLLVERTGHTVGYYSLTGEIRMLRGRGAARVALQTLRPTTAGAMQHLGQAVWVVVIGTSGDRLGCLAIAGTTLDDWDQIAAQQTGTALALELAKEHAVMAAEERLRGNFVQAVLMGPPDSEALLRRGQELGYDLRVPHAALLCAATPANESTAARVAMLLSSSLGALGIAAPTMRRDDGVLCYLPVQPQGPRAHELAERLRARMANEMPSMVLALGKDADSVAAWPRSLREAEQALFLGQQLFDTSRVLDFSDLGVYRLLVLLRESPELWDFYRSTLAALADYDARQKNELLKTLESFFACLGNLARTADTLHVHRNTLLYRLQRIKEISGLDLDDAEDRLALWLALKTHRVLQRLDEPAGE